ncbi:MAG: LytR C-terminal domain-containing protein [Gammaproteobacteria bacterium]|nr:LytR C-terminal domain-containing protein [Gammaproteobacteria bacterium]
MTKHFPDRAMRCVLSVSMVVALAGCASVPPGDSNSAGRSLSAVSSQRLSNLDLARREFSRGNYGNAISLLERELADRPASIAALNGLGACFDELGRYDVAQQYYYRALDMAPESSLTLSNIGYSYLQQGRHAEAAQIFELALQRDPENEIAANNLKLAKARLSSPENESVIALDSTAENKADVVLTEQPNQPEDVEGSTSAVKGRDRQEKSGAAVTDLVEAVSAASDQPLPVPEKTLPRPPSPAQLDTAVEGVSTVADTSAITPGIPVHQPATKIAAMRPLPILASSLFGRVAAFSSKPTAQAPSAPMVAEPGEEQFPLEVEINVPSAESPQALVDAVNEASEKADSPAVVPRAIAQPEAEIAAISSIPVASGSQQAEELAGGSGEAQAMESPAVPEPVQQPATLIAAIDPAPELDFLSQAGLPEIKAQLGDMALSSSVIPEPAQIPDESRGQAPEFPPPLGLTLLDMHDLPESTLRILESPEPTPEEVSDIQSSEQPAPDKENNEEPPVLAYEEVSEQLPEFANTAADEPPPREPTPAEKNKNLVSGLTLSEPFKLAVANGNGMRGIARATSRWIDNEQLQVTSITDADHFDYAQTVIRHRPEFAQFALAMAEKMAVNCEIQQSDDLAEGVDMQLILGQDFAGTVPVRDGWISLNDNEQVSHLDDEMRLEISNGNGVWGMAARLRTFLQIRGSSVVRLTNADNFAYDESILYYRPGTREAAERLVAALPVPNVSLHESSDLASRVDARLLVGRDFVPYDVGREN